MVYVKPVGDNFTPYVPIGLSTQFALVMVTEWKCLYEYSFCLHLGYGILIQNARSGHPVL